MSSFEPCRSGARTSTRAFALTAYRPPDEPYRSVNASFIRAGQSAEYPFCITAASNLSDHKARASLGKEIYQIVLSWITGRYYYFPLHSIPLHGRHTRKTKRARNLKARASESRAQVHPHPSAESRAEKGP